MRTLVLAIPALLATTLAVADPNTITLGNKSPAVGTKLTAEKSTTLDMVIHVRGKKVVTNKITRERKRIEVRAVGKGAVTKATVEYLEDSSVETIGGKKRTTPSPIVGKTYTLTAATPTKIDTANGPAPPEEARVVREREKSFGRPDRVKGVLAGKRFTKHKPLALSAREAEEAFSDDEDMEVTKMVLTYRGMDGMNAKFDVWMSARTKRPGMTMEIESTGTTSIDPFSGDVLEMTMAGPLKATGKYRVEGTMTFTAKHMP